MGSDVVVVYCYMRSELAVWYCYVRSELIGRMLLLLRSDLTVLLTKLLDIFYINVWSGSELNDKFHETIILEIQQDTTPVEVNIVKDRC